MKYSLLGLCNNIEQNLSKIKVWAKSFRSVCDYPINLLCANSSDEEIEMCKNIGINAIKVTIEDVYQINHKRLEKIREFIINSNDEYFLITDVFDVYFQKDPFLKLKNANLFFGLEGVLVNEEPWNGDNIKKIFPNYIEDCRYKDIICSGVIAGKREALISLYAMMFDLCEKGSNDHNIKDQAALIVLYAQDKLENYRLFSLNDNWVCHCAVSGPTMFFSTWGFDNLLRNKGLSAPFLNNGRIVNDYGEFDIVHQYNRVPDWNEMIIKTYE